MKPNTPKILIVDDREENLFALERVLESLPCQTIKASSGYEALHSVLNHEFAIIILDVQMPEMDGFETAENIRSIEGTKSVPIIFVTAINKDQTNIFKGYEAGAVDYIFKPFDPFVLKNKIKVFLELYRNKKELKDNEERLNSMFQALEDHVRVMDKDLNIVWANESVREFFNKNVIGEKCYSLYHKRNSACEGCLAKQVFKDNKPHSHEDSTAIIDPDGEEICFHCVSSPLSFDEDKTLKQIITISRDITEKKKFEKRINIERQKTSTANKDLLALLDREKDLVIKANKANDAKTDFISNIAHETKTPLNGILGFSEILLEDDLRSEQREQVEIIKKCGSDLLNMINDLLDYSKMEAGHMTLYNSSFDLPGLLEKLKQIISPTIRNKNVDLVSIYDENLPNALIGDEMRIEQILRNLLSNAAKFTSHGQITVEVKKLSESDKTITVEFKVTDTGMGIPETHLQTIFEAFRQVDDSTIKQIGGTGLGLAICKKNVELLGGEIQVSSELDKGTSFSFSLAFTKI